MDDVSIIIVSWNARGHLRNCLDSIRQTRGEAVREVIVVDNASSDGSPDMVAEQYPEVKLIRSDKNLGFARANNLGIRNACGSLLALVNSDVVVHPQCFQRLADFLALHPEAGLVGPKVFGGDGRLQRTCRLLPGRWNILCEAVALDRLFPHYGLFSGREMRHWDQSNTAEVEVLSGCFWLARRKAVEAVGGLDERFFFYAEDIDWCKRFQDCGWRVFFCCEATAVHFGGGSSSNAPLRYSIEMLRSNLAYWRKHHGWLGRLGFHSISILHFGFRVVSLGLLTLGRFANPDKFRHKLKENYVCFRWLVTGKGV
ncbi:MAG: glycosyltransferase family 2 protein [Candidatus Dormibacteraceae bacterium]